MVKTFFILLVYCIFCTIEDAIIEGNSTLIIEGQMNISKDFKKLWMDERLNCQWRENYHSKFLYLIFKVVGNLWFVTDFIRNLISKFQKNR